MKRLALLLRSELRLTRTALPVHGVAVVQPVVLFLLMTLLLPSPSLELQVARTEGGAEEPLMAALAQVGSPIGAPYVRPVPIDAPGGASPLQLIEVTQTPAGPIARQEFGLIDSNRLKNYRNRLSAAALHLWDDALGSRAVIVHEHPLLPRDMPYTLYFGMAMLVFTAFFASASVGSILTAQDLENETILEVRLAPVAASLVLFARLIRVTLTGLLASGVLLLVVSLVTRHEPGALPRASLVLLAMSLLGATVGVLIGLRLERSLPSFQAALVVSLVGWLLGGALDLPVTFGRVYEVISWLIPHSYAVHLLFGGLYGTETGDPLWFAAALCAFCAVGLVASDRAWRRRVLTLD